MYIQLIFQITNNNHKYSCYYLLIIVAIVIIHFSIIWCSYSYSVVFVGLFTFDEELKQTSHYQVKSSDITPFGLSSDDDDDFSTDGKVMGYQNLTVFI